MNAMKQAKERARCAWLMRRCRSLSFDDGDVMPRTAMRCDVLDEATTKCNVLDEAR
jgi:hypothetical protein